MRKHRVVRESVWEEERKTLDFQLVEAEVQVFILKKHIRQAEEFKNKLQVGRVGGKFREEALEYCSKSIKQWTEECNRSEENKEVGEEVSIARELEKIEPLGLKTDEQRAEYMRMNELLTPFYKKLVTTKKLVDNRTKRALCLICEEQDLHDYGWEFRRVRRMSTQIAGICRKHEGEAKRRVGAEFNALSEWTEKFREEVRNGSRGNGEDRAVVAGKEGWEEGMAVARS